MIARQQRAARDHGTPWPPPSRFDIHIRTTSRSAKTTIHTVQQTSWLTPSPNRVAGAHHGSLVVGEVGHPDRPALARVELVVLRVSALVWFIVGQVPPSALADWRLSALQAPRWPCGSHTPMSTALRRV